MITHTHVVVYVDIQRVAAQASEPAEGAPSCEYVGRGVCQGDGSVAGRVVFLERYEVFHSYPVRASRRNVDVSAATHALDLMAVVVDKDMLSHHVHLTMTSCLMILLAKGMSQLVIGVMIQAMTRAVTRMLLRIRTADP